MVTPMQRPAFYRYFLCFKPDAKLQRQIAVMAEMIGHSITPDVEDRLHLTLCILAEKKEQDHFIAQRLGAALACDQMAACTVKLGRWRVGNSGATLYTTGCQESIQAFYRALMQHLAGRDIVPFRPRMRLQPHITLGHAPLEPCIRNETFEWVPDAIVLIESHVGLSVHVELMRWLLMSPKQGELALTPYIPPSNRKAKR
jgi:2'-5' RNA ligase